ncbi:MAG: IMP cyclohydrolase [Halobacteriales archaeon]
MYLGRFAVVAPGWGAYRVSSRSFPEREIVSRNGALTVVQSADAPPTDNPYISYNCVRVLEDAAVIGNGSHVDPIAEKLGLGYPARDALALGLLGLDYEKDAYNTPRLAGVVGDEATIGIVRDDAIVVQAIESPTLVATYERDHPEAFDLEAEDAADLAKAVYDLEFEHPVCAAAVVRDGAGFETAVYNGPGG